jgi:hypothetical protein
LHASILPALMQNVLRFLDESGIFLEDPSQKPIRNRRIF